ncbi:MAG: hypothetical protein ACEQSH_00190 [Bacteroidia bacterium]
MPIFPLPGGPIDATGLGGGTYPLPGAPFDAESTDVTQAIIGQRAVARQGAFGEGLGLKGQRAGGRQGSLGTAQISASALTGQRARMRGGSFVAPPVIRDLLWATVNPVRARTIPSYLYIQYNDDEALQAFVDAYNALAQEIITWSAETPLAVYTSQLITGALLDLIATAIYGQARPLLPAGSTRTLGPYNTARFNVLRYDERRVLDPDGYYATNDDIYKRIVTWNFYKGDGRAFTVQWLKRRIQRFLEGVDGTDPPVDQTYQISISFGVGEQVNIRLLSGIRNVTGGAFYNRNRYNTTRYNQLDTTYVQLTPLANAAIFKAAVDAGVLQLPFQYDWVVTI